MMPPLLKIGWIDRDRRALALRLGSALLVVGVLARNAVAELDRLYPGVAQFRILLIRLLVLVAELFALELREVVA